MPIGHLARPFVLVAAAVSLCQFLRADTERVQTKPSLVYVGAWTAEGDTAFVGFTEALRREHPLLAKTISVTYVHGPDDDETALRNAIRRAADLRPFVLVAPTADSARVAWQAAPGVPVVFASFLDPVRAGIVDSLRRPGGHLTGVSLADDLHLKRLELLRDAFPGIRRVGIIADRSWAAAYDGRSIGNEARSRYGIQTTLVVADTLDEFRRSVRSETPRQDAWYVPPTYLGYKIEAELIAELGRLGQPAIHSTRGEVQRGALMAYSQDLTFAFPAMADLVKRIHDGESPSAIPIERPRRFVLTVRRPGERDALHIHPSLVMQADELQ